MQIKRSMTSSVGHRIKKSKENGSEIYGKRREDYKYIKNRLIYCNILVLKTSGKISVGSLLPKQKKKEIRNLYNLCSSINI